MFNKYGGARHEMTASLIYQIWVQEMVEAGHGDKVYIWDAGWVKDPFIKAVSRVINRDNERFIQALADRMGVGVDIRTPE